LKWLGPKDFDFSVLLGSGGFGAVFKAKRKSTGMDYALKVQPIETMARSARCFGKNSEDETLIHMERTVLASCRKHPFIVNLEYAFYTDIHAVLGLEYVPGGTLSTLISKSPGKRLPFSLCKTYAMELILALNYMHCKGIIYRDLKVSMKNKSHFIVRRAGSIIFLTKNDIGMNRSLPMCYCR
jgi:serine/threonine protein kinase